MHILLETPEWDETRRAIPSIAVLGGKIVTHPDEPDGKGHLCTDAKYEGVRRTMVSIHGTEALG